MAEKVWSCQKCGTEFSVSNTYHKECMSSPKPKLMKCPHCGAADSFPVDVAMGREKPPSWMRIGGGDLRNAAEDYAKQHREYQRVKKGPESKKNASKGIFLFFLAVGCFLAAVLVVLSYPLAWWKIGVAALCLFLTWKIMLIGPYPFFGTLVIVAIILPSPMLAYKFGMDQVLQDPVASSKTIDRNKELETWDGVYGSGYPMLEPITSYGGVRYLICLYLKGANQNVCESAYPGVRAAFLSVSPQVSRELRSNNDSLRHTQPGILERITWGAHTVWVTKNWDIHQVLATLYDENHAGDSVEPK